MVRLIRKCAQNALDVITNQLLKLMARNADNARIGSWRETWDRPGVVADAEIVSFCRKYRDSNALTFDASESKSTTGSRDPRACCNREYRDRNPSGSWALKPS